MKYIKLVIAIFITCIAVFFYSRYFGNPIQYLKAKKVFESYIDKNYKGNLEINSISFDFKTGGFYAEIEDDEHKSKSYLDYYSDNSVGDGYYQDTIANMQNEINNYVSYNIEKDTKIKRDFINIDSTISIKQFKYKINDFYSGKEPINLSLELGYTYDFDEKNEKDSEKNKFPYKNQEEFLKDAYKILVTLKKINYDFSSVKIYSFKEDGNNVYELKIKNIHVIKSQQDLKKIIKNVDYSKTE